jgi:LmbE family N-acetylglucosaminyl deacetylase
MPIPERAARVLAIGAHPEDIELGAGGTIHRLTYQCQATVHFLIFTEGLEGLEDLDLNRNLLASLRRQEAQVAAELLGVGHDRVEKGIERAEVLSYPDCKLHENGHHLTREIEQRVYDDEKASKYDLILSHAGGDTHHDHRTVHESTLSAVRYFHGSVLLYQSPSVKPNGFQPTYFARLNEENIKRKAQSILAHVSQRKRNYTREHWIRGISDNWATFLRMPEGTYLEAFEVYKSFF